MNRMRYSVIEMLKYPYQLGLDQHLSIYPIIYDHVSMAILLSMTMYLWRSRAIYSDLGDLWLFVYPSLPSHLSIYLYIYLSTYLSVYLAIYLYISSNIWLSMAMLQPLTYACSMLATRLYMHAWSVGVTATLCI